MRKKRTENDSQCDSIIRQTLNKTYKKKSYDSTIDRHLISFHNYCRHLLNDCLKIDLFFFLEIQYERKI